MEIIEEFVFKKCSTCTKFFPRSLFKKDSKGFLGLSSRCKECYKIYYNENKKSINARKRELNKTRYSDKIKQYSKKRYSENKEKQITYSKEYQKRNPEVKKRNDKKYYETHREELNAKKLAYHHFRYKNDPLYKLIKLVRGRTKDYCRVAKIRKSKRFHEYIGCTPEELRLHIEKQFKDGMSWENYGKWHIDHIIPISSAKTEREVYILSHYTNLQPLWAEENLKKGDKVCQAV